MMLSEKINSYLIPEWPAPAQVRAVVTTRQCGNLAMHVNDDPVIVAANRQRLQEDLNLPQQPLWVEQVHGVDAVNLDSANPATVGDAVYTQRTRQVCAILTADCLPIFITSRDGRKIAVVHAGWRGLAAGVIDVTVRALQIPAADLLVWLGPAIGPDHFEVGLEVREKFIARHADYAAGFQPINATHWLADLYQLATVNLGHCGITAVYGGGLCTFCDHQRFFSYRREHGKAGRMASLIWRSQ